MDKTCLSSTSHRCSIGFRSGEVSRSTLQTHRSSKHFCTLPCYRGHSTQIKSTTMMMFVLCVCDHCSLEHHLKSTPTIIVHKVGFGQCTYRERNKGCGHVTALLWYGLHRVINLLPGFQVPVTLLFSHFASVKIEILIHSPFLLACDFPTEGVSGLHAHRIHLVLCILFT